jgi:hypothetical protein
VSGGFDWNDAYFGDGSDPVVVRTRMAMTRYAVIGPTAPRITGPSSASVSVLCADTVPEPGQGVCSTRIASSEI